jgi:hypothetical protein
MTETADNISPTVPPKKRPESRIKGGKTVQRVQEEPRLTAKIGDSEYTECVGRVKDVCKSINARIVSIMEALEAQSVPAEIVNELGTGSASVVKAWKKKSLEMLKSGEIGDAPTLQTEVEILLRDFQTIEDQVSHKMDRYSRKTIV